jgi:hypothetical protein
MPSIEVMLLKARLSWLGHIARMGEERTVKRLLFGQMAGGRKVGKPPATLRRTFQVDVRVLQGGVPNGMAWYEAAQDRARWRGLVANTAWGRGDEAAAAAGHGGGDAGGNAG